MIYGTIALTLASSPLLEPDNIFRDPFTADYERGGSAVGVAGFGMNVRNWRLRADQETGNFYTSPFPYTAESLVFTAAGNITEATLAFDQNMQPVIGYVADGTAYLRWYSTALGDYTITEIGAGVVSPFLTLDDKRRQAQLLALSDVVLFYIDSGDIYYRLQREDYATPHLVAAGEYRRIYGVGMDRGNRLRLKVR